MDNEVKSSFIPFSIKFGLLILLITKFSVLISIISLFILNYIYYYILSYYFGLQELTGYDKVFLNKIKSNKVTLIIKLKFSNYNVEKMQDFIYNKLISKIPRLRSKLIFTFYEYFFKEVKSHKNIKDKQIIINQNIKEEDIENIIQNEINNPIDIFNEMPYKFLLYNIEKSYDGFVLFKYDHILSDGLGIICSLCLISDNFNVNLYPKLLQRMKEPNIFQKIYLNIASIFYMIYIIYCNFKNKISKNNIFRDNYHIIKSSSINIGEEFNLKDFENYRKENKVSFNDIMINSFIKTLLEIEKDNKFKNINIVLPVGITVPPSKLENLKMLNQARWVTLKLPMTDKMKLINKTIKKNLSPEILFSLGKLDDLEGKIFNAKTLNQRFIKKALNYDFVFTNIPGPTTKLIYNNMICEDIFFFSNAGWGVPFIFIFSYNGKFRTAISCDSKFKDNSSIFLKYFDNNTHKFISK